MEKIKPLGKITEYSYKENFAYDEAVVTLVKEHRLLLPEQIGSEIDKFLRRFGTFLNDVQTEALQTRIRFALDYLKEQENKKKGLIKLDNFGFEILKKSVGRKVKINVMGLLGTQTYELKIIEVDGTVAFAKKRARSRYYPVTSFWKEWYEFID